MKTSKPPRILRLMAVVCVLLPMAAYQAARGGEKPGANEPAQGPHGGVIAKDGTERPLGRWEAKGADIPFVDFPPLASTASAPASGECSDRASRTTHGKTPWRRGYEQAMSGRRFRAALMNGARIVHSPLQACYEYQGRSTNEPNDHSCCMAGYTQGYKELQVALLESAAGGEPKLRSPRPDDAQQCYRAFGLGLQAAKRKCAELTASNAAVCGGDGFNDPTEYLGCASLGYLASMLKCPKAQASREALRRALEGGAIFAAGGVAPLEPLIEDLIQNNRSTAGEAQAR